MKYLFTLFIVASRHNRRPNLHFLLSSLLFYICCERGLLVSIRSINKNK